MKTIDYSGSGHNGQCSRQTAAADYLSVKAHTSENKIQSNKNEDEPANQASKTVA